jgi:hypothetical protein
MNEEKNMHIVSVVCRLSTTEKLIIQKYSHRNRTETRFLSPPTVLRHIFHQEREESK